MESLELLHFISFHKTVILFVVSLLPVQIAALTLEIIDGDTLTGEHSNSIFTMNVCLLLFSIVMACFFVTLPRMQPKYRYHVVPMVLGSLIFFIMQTVLAKGAGGSSTLFLSLTSIAAVITIGINAAMLAYQVIPRDIRN